jgi:hypothetical protein
VRIHADVELLHPRERAFEAYRDRMVELVEFLPNIRSIRVISREERGPDVVLVNEWVGGGDIPSVARAVLKDSMLRWTDYATWRGESHTVEWRTEVHAFPGAVKAMGTNRFVETPRGSRLEIRGELTCDSAKVPGVPRILARTVNAAAEKILVGQIGHNLAEIGRGVAKLLDRG